MKVFSTHEILQETQARLQKVKSERDALAAKLSIVIAAWNGYDYEAINAEINKTPQQCLAEIKAEAGRAGFIACAEWVGDSEYEVSHMLKTADEYAEQIRQGGVK